MNHSRFMKIKTSDNCFVRLVLLDFRSQFFTSHAIFNCRAYAQRVDRIIPCKSSSFSIRTIASRATLPTPQASKSNTFNNCSEANLTKGGFGSGGHCFARVIKWFHSRSALARARLAAFWSFRLCTAIASLKMRTFILPWSWCRGPPAAVEGLPRFDFSTTKPCTSFKCCVNSHFAQYATVQLWTLHFHLDPTFVQSLSFRARLGGQITASGWEACSVSSSGPKPKNKKFNKQNAGIAKHQITKLHITSINMNCSKVL